MSRWIDENYNNHVSSLKLKSFVLADLTYFYQKAAHQGGGGGALGASAAVKSIMVVNVMLYPMQVGTFPSISLTQ